jgi:hypothetical protein
MDSFAQLNNKKTENINKLGKMLKKTTTKKL